MILELHNIYKTYDQGKLEVPVLKDITLSVAEGEYLAIMGPSGSGKTTLMNIIGCLDTPTSGEYYLEDEELSTKSDAQLSQVRLRSIGFVFQSFHLLSRQSALENVALPLLYAGVKKNERLRLAREALERVGLGDRVDFKPTQLSGGQCQRVAIARAIVNRPKILLADEPTGALDTKAGEQIMDVFKMLNDQGVTVVMITHEPEIAAHAKRVLHIRDGQLVNERDLPKQEQVTAAVKQSQPSEAELMLQKTVIFPTAALKTFAAQREYPIEIEDIESLIEREKPVQKPVERKAKPIEIESIVTEIKREKPVQKPVERKAKPIEIESIVTEVKREQPAQKPVERKAKPIEIESIVTEVKREQPAQKPVERKAKPIEIESIVTEVKREQPVQKPVERKAKPIEIESIVTEVKREQPIAKSVEISTEQLFQTPKKKRKKEKSTAPRQSAPKLVDVTLPTKPQENSAPKKLIDIEAIIPEDDRRR